MAMNESLNALALILMGIGFMLAREFRIFNHNN
jgi:hypothetical protein